MTKERKANWTSDKRFGRTRFTKAATSRIDDPRCGAFDAARAAVAKSKEKKMKILLRQAVRESIRRAATQTPERIGQ
jgi:hypothetical protein